MVTLSDAINITSIPESNYFEITNIISGKCFKMDAATLKVLYSCKNMSDKNIILGELQDIGYSLNEANSFIQKMIISNILQSGNYDDIIEFEHYRYPLFGIKPIDIHKITNQCVCIVGLPFGNGNFVDARCKCFPKHIRNFTKNIFGNKSIAKNLDTFNFKSISDSFDIQNFGALLCSDKVLDCGDLIYTAGENNSGYYHKIFHLYNLHIFPNKNIPISIGGDHSITYPILKALDANQKSFDLVQFDAHSDFKSSKITDHYLKFEILNHANVMNYCIMLNNLSNLYQIGVREPFIAHHEKIHNISIDEARNKHDKWTSLVTSKRPLYISIDVDSFDPSIISGTANKLPNGLLYDEALQCLKELINQHPILGIDIVEANHKLDPTDMTTHVTKNIILFIISLLTLNA